MRFRIRTISRQYHLFCIFSEKVVQNCMQVPLTMLKACRRNGMVLFDFLKRHKSGKSGSRPVKWLEDAAVYTDTHTAFVDPCTSLPYPTEVHPFCTFFDS